MLMALPTWARVPEYVYICAGTILYNGGHLVKRRTYWEHSPRWPRRGQSNTFATSPRLPLLVCYVLPLVFLYPVLPLLPLPYHLCSDGQHAVGYVPELFYIMGGV